jgi:hypothetical protein
MSDRAIASYCGVDNKTVSRIRRESENLTSEFPKSHTRRGSDGRVIDTTNIGRPPEVGILYSPPLRGELKRESPRLPDFPKTIFILAFLDEMTYIYNSIPRQPYPLNFGVLGILALLESRYFLQAWPGVLRHSRAQCICSTVLPPSS